MDETEIKGQIKSLVDKYEFAKSTTGLRNYSEEDTTNGFILPLFHILGWDTFDKKEVSAQEHIKGSGRPDYTFKINGITQFYLEAKKFSADLDDPKFAFQVINYSWNKGITYAILTDFESIKVFNAQRIDKFDLMDKLVFEISYTKYIEEFATLYLLSRQSFENKKLDSFAERYGKREKMVSVASVIKKLNEDIQWCRERLTKSFEICNDKKNIPKDLLDEGVQKLLDRLIFLRVAEDRDVEPNILKNLLRESETTKDYKPFQAMVSTFRELDKTYNSNLFSHHPFEEWEEWDGALKQVIDKLYGSKGYYEYNFKEMPADVLGSVYESYLGYKLSTAKSKNRKLFDEGREITINKDAKKRKEQGIYYTPIFIVDYIVRNALKPVLDKCVSIHDLKKIKVLDPACGSGSFLIKVLEAIAEKYKEFGTDNEMIKRQIILENIYGVDLDMQAVEIARLNLLINSLDSKAALPMLDKNIKNGNSLIFGTDEELEKRFGKNWRDKKPFNWQEEFPEVFAQGGFDVIIGNPPYIKEDVNKNAFDGLHDSLYYQGKMDIWTMFACVSIDLLKDSGIMSFIAPNNWVSNAGASIFRDKILKDGELKTLIDFGDYKVFEQAGIQTMIYIFEKKKPDTKYLVEYLRIDDKNIPESKLTIDISSDKQKIEIKPQELRGHFLVFNESGKNTLLKKIKSKSNYIINDKDIGNGIDVLQDFVSQKHLSDLSDRAIKKGDGVFVLSDDEIKIISPTKLETHYLRPYYTTMEINRYSSTQKTNYKIIYADNYFREHIEEFPNLKKHLDKFSKILTSAYAPYGLHRAREERFFEGDSVFSIRKTKKPAFSYVDFPCYVTRAFIVLKLNKIDSKYAIGLLNSSLMYFWLKNKGKLQGDQLQIDKEPLLEVPICVGDGKEQKLVIDLVDKMIKLHKKLAETEKDSNAWHKLKEEIELTDKKIDAAVYKLYGLTEEEIKIVENSSKNNL
ncbi:MAG: N-6 DNA methylase [Candidatus Vogelbacteria bacterium]|nr:N-6 DNA methylase [Candidatus Vogelbacteria bacterium]